MATIIENLKKILEARYGKDVRQAIHDSIENCYNDGKAGSIDLQARQMLGDTNISSIADGTVTGSVKTLSDKATANEEAISEVNNKLGNTDISAIGDGTLTGGLDALNSNLPVFFGYSEYYTSKTSDFERINYQITIPDNCIFSVGIQCYFSNSYPVGSCIANIDFNPYNRLAYNENIPFCSYTGYTRYEITLDFYGKWDGGASNLVSIGGFYKRM